jgi:23S rRNA (cytidine1920-2'-O)/16S rRNA (cytidine1409-2'-O)-methyltransferase
VTAVPKRRTVSLYTVLKNRYEEFSDKELYSLILCGEIKVDGGILRDPKAPVDPACQVEFLGRRFVSRGGEKLDHGLTVFGIDVEGLVIVDAGSSTGGFTHCLLSRGALAVHAVDVGYNQLDYSLRQDPRVIVHERTNVMDFHDPQPVPQGAVADLSFRSIRGAASHLLSLTSEKWLVALIKPQFEYPNPPEEFDGVIKEEEVLREILAETLAGLEEEGVYLHAAAVSPITGRKGNREFLFHLKTIRASLRGQDILKALDF